MANKWDYKKKLEESKNWNIPDSEKAALKLYANEYASGRITNQVPNKPDATIESALSRLKVPLEHINKSFDKAVFMPSKLKDNKPNKNYEKELKQYEQDKKIFLSDHTLKLFIDDLLQNKIKVKVIKWVGKELKPVDIKPYSNTGKDRIIEYLITYVKFRFNDKEVEEARLKKILDVKINTSQNEPKTLTKEEVNRLINECDLEKECYLKANSRGGFRGGEFHTVQMQGVRLPDLKEGRRWLEIDVIESKTKTRLVKIYDVEAARTIAEYYNQRLREGARQTDLFFNNSHTNMRQWLRRTSLRVLGKSVHPHMLRATAVTLNAESGLINNDADMNKFYGWVPGTGTSRRYLNMSKISLKNVDKQAEALEGIDYNKKLERIEFEKNMEMEELRKSQEKLQQVLGKIMIDFGYGGTELSEEFFKANIGLQTHTEMVEKLNKLAEENEQSHH